MRFISCVLCLGIVYLCFNALECQKTTPKSSDAISPKPPKIISIGGNSSDIRRYWMSADKYLKTAMGKLIKTAMPIVLREVYSKNISSNCLAGLLYLTTGLKKTKLWAFEMLDASGKLPEGFLRGTVSILGDFEECVEIDVKEKKLSMQGQYCTIQVSPPLPDWRPFISIHVPDSEVDNISDPNTVVHYLTQILHNLHVIKIKMGVCIPAHCTPTDLQNLIQIIPEKTGLDTWKFDVDRCEVKTDLNFTYTQMVILCIFGILLFLIVCGSLADLAWNVDEFSSNDVKRTILQYVISFSLFANSRKLANFESIHGNLKFIHGIIFLCVFWIIIANSFMYVNYHIAGSIIVALNVTKLLFFEIVLNRTIPIQTFFFLSGFVAAYKWMRTPQENLSIWKYIFKRYWRYTPTYILMLALVMLTPTWGSGPSWKDNVDKIYDRCYNTWWGNLFYINNFLDMKTSCLDHTWVIAVDAQLHLFGLLILIPLKRRPAIGLMLNFVLLGASLLTVALTNVYYNIPPNEMLPFLHERDRSFFASHTYFRIYTHLCMYCSGIAAAYFVTVKPKFKASKKLTWFMWFTLSAVALAVMYVLQEWRSGILPAPLIGAMYAAFGKMGWASFLAWVAVNCSNGNGGGLKDFLSWRPFSFFTRLVFIAYIIHPVIIQVSLAFKKNHMYTQQFELIYSVLAHIFGTYFVAYVCHIAFEAPFLSVTEVVRTKCCSSRFNVKQSENTNVACNGVLTEKPMKYEDKRKQDEKLREVNIRTKF